MNYIYPIRITGGFKPKRSPWKQLWFKISGTQTILPEHGKASTSRAVQHFWIRFTFNDQLNQNRLL